jgi:hypothetical protein
MSCARAARHVESPRSAAASTLLFLEPPRRDEDEAACAQSWDRDAFPVRPKQIRFATPARPEPYRACSCFGAEEIVAPPSCYPVGLGPAPFRAWAPGCRIDDAGADR